MIALGAALLLAGASAAAEPPRLNLSLAQAEAEALAHSPVLKAAESDLDAAEAQVDAAFSGLVPRLTLDGSYQYQTHVPQAALGRGAPALQFGDHNVYSVGPSLTYTLWDQGALRKQWRSQKALAASRDAQRALLRRQVRLAARLGYFSVQLGLEQERSLLDSLRLASAQERDIDSRFRAGAAARIDWLSARQQVLDRRRELRAAQADLAASLRALFALTGRPQDADLSAPLDARVEEALPPGVSSPTVVIALDALETVEAALAGAADAPLDPAHPQLAAYERQAEAQRLEAAGLSAGRWPRVQLALKSAELYPDTPALKRAWQNTASIGASVPLFEAGRSSDQARAQEALASGSDRRRDEARDELERDRLKARDALAALRDEEELDRVSVAETDEISRLRYASYRAGGSTILDVETAAANAVQARVLAARTRVQALIQLATLDSLSPDKGTP